MKKMVKGNSRRHFNIIPKNIVKCKRSQAQIIVTVLIILLVLAAVVIVWGSVRSSVEESSGELGGKVGTLNVELKAVKIDASTNMLTVSRTASGDNNAVSDVVIYVDGAVVEHTCPDDNCSLESLGTKDYTLSGVVLLGGEKIKIVPLLITGDIGSLSDEIKIRCYPIGDCNAHDGQNKDTYGDACLAEVGCSTYEKWCDGFDMNQDGSVGSVDIIWIIHRNGKTGCNYHEFATGDGIGSDWCEGADRDQNGIVDTIGDRLGITGSSCNLPENIYVDCYSTENCAESVDEASCLDVPGCSWE